VATTHSRRHEALGGKVVRKNLGLVGDEHLRRARVVRGVANGDGGNDRISRSPELGPIRRP